MTEAQKSTPRIRQALAASQLRSVTAANSAPATEFWLGPGSCLVDSLDSPRLANKLTEILRRAVSFDRALLVAYDRNRRPWILHDADAANPRRRGDLLVYLKGSYLFDPYYRAFLRGCRARMYPRIELMPLGLTAAEHFDHPQRPFGWVDHLAFLAPISCRNCLSLCLLREGASPAFSVDDLDRLRGCEQVVCAALRVHWKAYAARIVDHDCEADGLFMQVERALDGFGRTDLTMREAEVIRAILRGNSMKAAAAKLGIATATAALHRKKAYAKLGVTSMGELFRKFVTSLTDR